MTTYTKRGGIMSDNKNKSLNNILVNIGIIILLILLVIMIIFSFFAWQKTKVIIHYNWTYVYIRYFI